MKSRIFSLLVFLITLPPILIEQVRRVAVWIATRRFYLLSFIPCSAGLWSLGLYLWNRPSPRRSVRALWIVLSYLALLVGSFLFVAGLWRFALILLAIRILIWLDRALNLGKPLEECDPNTAPSIIRHPLDRFSLVYILVVFVALAIGKERLTNLTDPSDNFYHMAVAKQILDRGEIPLWDDWEFAPMGRPHLYPPLLHLLIALWSRASDNVMVGFATLLIFLYPAALFSYWYLIRYLAGSPLAFLSLIVIAMDMIFGLGCLLGLPASIVNVLWPWILIAFLEKRKYLAAILLAAAFYTHMGMPVLVSLCILLYGLWKREHLGRALFVIAAAYALFLPWAVRFFVFNDWIHSGGAEGFSWASFVSHILWLQIINPLFLILLFWGWWLCRDERLKIMKAQAIGFLPMLVQYGGRFFMHGTPLLAPFIAYPFLRFVDKPINRRRALGFLLLTLIPLPCISFIGENDTTKPGFAPSITGSHFSLFLTIDATPKKNEPVKFLAETLCATTAPDTIIHLPDTQPHFADMIVVLTGRRTDAGGWGEIRKPEMWSRIEQSRKNPQSGIFVALKPESIPAGYRVEEVSPYLVGYPPAVGEISLKGELIIEFSNGKGPF